MGDLPKLLWTRAELIAMRRCPDCSWHPPTQGHHDNCPNNESRKS